MKVSYMTTEEEINEIESTRYNNYKGRVFEKIGNINNLIRNKVGDVEYLKYLKTQENNNPKPQY